MTTPYTITYSNHFKVGDNTFAFRNKELFNITKTPTYISLKQNNGSKGYWINREWFSLTKIKSIITNTPITVDVSNLNWDHQCRLDGVFNL